MTGRAIVTLVVLACMNFSIRAQQPLRVFALDGPTLLINKKKISEKDQALMPAYESLMRKADALLDKPVLTVMEKKQMPPSGNKHDYMSIAIYFWPDPSKPNGLPYIRKDGQINPEVKDYRDKENLVQMCKNLEILSLAYYFSNDTRYSKKAMEQIRAWFLEDATRMNPNFNFAQAVKGKNDGRGIGIIESRDFTKVIDAVGLLASDRSWTKKDQQGMQQWFADFLSWLITSKNGIEESNAENNHGVWYDTQKISFALFSENKEIALSGLKSLRERMEKQMDTTGFFPAELERTISLHYSAFILEPLFLCANMSTHLNADLWNEEPASGKSLKKAFEAVQPYLSKSNAWPYQQIKEFDFESNATPLLAQGYMRYHCMTCKTSIDKLLGDYPDKSILHLINIID